MIISLIAAIGRNRELGLNNELIWRIPDDLKNFKRITLGHHLLMGRKTFESIGRPLPQRTTIILSRDPTFRAEGCLVAASLEAGLELAREAGERELMVCGGASLYQATLPLAHRMYLSVIEDEAQADVFFPLWDQAQWRELSAELHPEQGADPAWRFHAFERR